MIEMWHDESAPDALSPVREAKAWIEAQFARGMEEHECWKS